MALLLSSKSRNNTVLGKFFSQSLKEVYFFQFPLLKSGASDSTKDLTEWLRIVLKYRESRSEKDEHCSTLLCFRTGFPWCTPVTVWPPSPSSSSHFGIHKFISGKERGNGNHQLAQCWEPNFQLQNVEENPAVLHWVAPGAAVGLAGRGMSFSMKPSCTVSFKLVVKGETVQPAVAAAGQSRVAWGTLIVDFLTPVWFKILLKTSFFFFLVVFFI